MRCCSHQAKNRHDGPVVGHARVLVADGGGEEFEEAARGVLAGVGDDAGHHDGGRDAAADARAGRLTVSWRVGSGRSRGRRSAWV